jgi:transposase
MEAVRPIPRVKISELERKIEQQALDIDFFHKALRALDAADRQGSIAPASRKSSKS